MKFTPSLISGRLIKRYKRFMADIELEDGSIVTAHCANPGAMLGLLDAGNKVWVNKSPDPNRKLAYNWQLVECEDTIIGVNTSLPNLLAHEAILAGAIPELIGYEKIRREVKYGVDSRIDFLLEGEGRPSCYVEVKNVHLKRNNTAQFPDSVTARGTKHLQELTRMTAEGFRCVMLYVIQRNDCDAFSLAADIDVKYADAAVIAKAAGVEFLAYCCEVTSTEVKIVRPLSPLL